MQDFINSAQSGIHTHDVAGVVEEHVNDFFLKREGCQNFKEPLKRPRPVCDVRNDAFLYESSLTCSGSMQPGNWRHW